MLDELMALARDYGNLSGEIQEELANLENDIRKFRAYVPFMGIFTVGKSSLLNAWLEENLLPEDQGPTTALPTELLPGPTQGMVIVLEDGRERIVPNLPGNEDEANAPEASDGIYAYCTSPSRNLEQVFPIVPVDMPGINSGVRRHTEAIYRYANRGSAFFLVFMPEEGTLPGAMKAFLQELDLRGRPVWVIITKCDTVHQEKIESVTEDIRGQLRLLDIEPAGLLHCARGDRNTAAALQTALQSLNVEQLNFLAHRDEILKIGLRLKEQIETLLNSEKLDSGDIERQIRIYEKTGQELQEAFQREERKFSKKLANLPVTVGNDVMAALKGNIDALVSAFEQGEEVFATRITGIINKVINESIDANLQKDFGELSKELAANMKIDEKDLIDQEKIKKGLQDVTRTLVFIAGKLESIRASGKIYKIVTTGLALTTSVVGPIVELVIIFLPELFSLFVDKKAMIRERFRSALLEKVFPAVQHSVICELKKELPAIEAELLSSMRKEWSDRLDDVRKALEMARESKQEASKKHAEAEDVNARRLERLNKVLLSARSFAASPRPEKDDRA